MDSFKRYWKSIPAAVRKPLVFIIGTFVVIVGLVLLPLPGPGWLIIFGGFAILATEFAAAEKVRSWLVDQMKLALEKTKKAWAKFKRQA
ncbi:TIGR02611 family protein [Candidatus Saccharibacteria bacterium]|nr:TIGR02611 family protein [Candidatus Saccharibacteria bacterium]